MSLDPTNGDRSLVRGYRYELKGKKPVTSVNIDRELPILFFSCRVT